MRFELIDTGGVDLAAEDSLVARRPGPGARRRSPTPTRSRSWSTPAPGCARATPRSPRSCAGRSCRWSSSPTRSTAPSDEPLGGRAQRARPRRADRGLGRARPRHRRPARPHRGAARRSPRRDEADATRSVVRLAVIGRPNVGKSSLVNAFLGARAGDRLRAGRDDARRDRHAARGRRPRRAARRHGRASAGAPRSPGTVDYYAQLRSERAAERADVALVVCDAAEGVTAEDLRVAELAMKTGCATLVALNKWDVGRDATSRTPRRGSRSGSASARR